MTDRLELAKAFVQRNGGDVSTIRMIAGDASNRKYFRLQHNALSVILMDAPPSKGEDVGPFIAIAEFLTSVGLSAPGILAADSIDGFLLLEDLGDDLFARVLEKNRNDEQTLYDAAIDVLSTLGRKNPPDLAHYDSSFMAPLAALSVEWYAQHVSDEIGKSELTEFETEIRSLLAPFDTDCSVLIQRDYHAENLIWLPARNGVKRVGLLDFQDAMLGHPAYDLVSVLQDARRDVPQHISANALERYSADYSGDQDQFQTAYHALGLQRNLRILGVFARLCIRDGKPEYLDLIPRVWSHILHCLDHLEDTSLTQTITALLQEPNQDRLRTLRGFAS